MSWGFHLMLDVHGCDLSAMQDRAVVKAFCKELVAKIEMEPIGEPWVEETAMHDVTKAGFTLVQLIQTSSIVAHFIDEPRDIYLDVFSCKPFSVAVVESCVAEWFKPQTRRLNFVTRQA